MTRKLDNALFAAITRKWDRAAIDGYSQRMRRRTAATPAHVADLMQRIDTKATGLLTHSAMMIAGLGIVAPLVADHPLEQAIIIAQMCVYLLIAVGCLRCLSVLDTVEGPTNDAAARKHVDRELLIRQELYRICHGAAIVFTLVVFISLPLMLAWRP
jgi:hypothetical protein